MTIESIPPRDRSRFRSAAGRLAAPAAALLAAALACAAQAEGAESATTGKLDFVAKDFAFDRRTGNVAATDPKGDAVSLYAVDFAADGLALKPVARVNVGDAPAWIAWKELGDKRFFIVGCLKDPAVYLLSADDLKQVARIPVDGTSCVGVWVTDSADDPYAYASFYIREGTGEVRKIHLLKQADEGAKFGVDYRFAISPRGTYAYSCSAGRSWTLFQPPPPTGPARPDIRTILTTRRAHGEIVVNNEETTAAIGETLFSAALDRQIGALPMEAAAFFAARPVVVGFNGGQFDPKSKAPDGPKPLMVFASTDNWKKIDAVEVPAALLLGRYDEDSATPEEEPYRLGGRPTRVFADDARGRVVAARNDQLTIVKLAGAKLPDDPVLRLEIAGKAEIVPGRKNVIPLKAVDPRVKITLVDPVDDMKLTPEGLEWTPAAGSVGERKVAVRLIAGAVEKIQIIELRATRDEITLPFMADGLQLSADGKEAIAWSYPLRPSRGGPAPNESQSQAAVVNLESKKVEVSGLLPCLTRRAAVDASHIYAAWDNVLSTIDRKTLRVERRMFVDSEVAAVATIEGGKLLVCLADGRRMRYATPDLRLEADYQVAVAAPPIHVHRNAETFARTPPAIELTNDGLAFGDGDVFDRGFTKPLFLERVPSFRPVNRPRGESSQPRAPLKPTEADHLSVTARQVVAVAHSSEPWGIVALVFAAKPRFAPSNFAAKTPEGYSLEIHDAIDWKAEPRIVPLTADAPSVTTLNSERRGRGDVLVRDGTAYCVCGDRLLKSAPTSPANSNLSPPKFRRRQSTIVLDPVGKTRLTNPLVGGEEPNRMALAKPMPGLSIESDGTVIVDGPQLSAHALDVVGGSLDLSTSIDEGSRFQSAEEMDQYDSRVRPLFRQITGRDPRGIPLVVAIQLEDAKSPEQPAARLLYYTLIEIPREQIVERLSTLAARKAAARAAAADPVKSEDQAKALERRLAAAEAELKRITEEIAKRLEQ